MIAFTRIEDGGIYLVRSSGGEIALLARVGTETHGQPQNLEWSPDGSKLAFESGGRIWVMDADGSDLTPLTGRVRRKGDLVRGWSMSPSWSPDGRRIAYTLGDLPAWGGGKVDRDVWVMNADGSNKRRLALTSDCAESLVDWSPKGGRLVTECDGLTVMNAAGGSRRSLFPGTPPIYALDWAPDGRRIVLFGFTRVGRGISVIDADAGSLVRLTARGDEPAWSPDGRRIAFARRGAVRIGIYVMKPDGTGVTRLTSGRHFGPTWQPTSAP
jgi:TolB protein